MSNLQIFVRLWKEYTESMKYKILLAIFYSLIVAGSTASLICDDFTRPWAERPTRCWIHEASGQVEGHTFQGSQERVMIARLVGEQSLAKWQKIALDTHLILDAINASVASNGSRVSVRQVIQ